MDAEDVLPILFASAGLYLVAGSVYRLYFHRTSHIPGPKLAALTYLYQAYYDLFPYTGQWIFEQVRLHSVYGPIVRVGPDEVHIDDPEFYKEFSGNDTTKKRDKSKLFYWFVGAGDLIDSSSFATMHADHHAMRRRALEGFYREDVVKKLEGRISVHIKKMRNWLIADSEGAKAVNLLPLMSALTLDVVSEYSFGTSTNTLETPGLGEPVRKNIEIGVRVHPFARVFPGFMRAVIQFVDVVAPYFSLVRGLKSFETMIHGLTSPTYKRAKESEKNGEIEAETSVVQALVHSEMLPPEEKTLSRIMAEMGGVIGGGAETLGRTLAVGTYHVLANPGIHSRVLAELRTLMPTKDSPLPSFADLKRLPYFTATIHEATRIAHGVTGRIVRISPENDVVYTASASAPKAATATTDQPIVIPRGTTFSMSHYIQHTNPAKFPEPGAFRPERYLGEEGKETLKYLFPFGTGPRSCLGINIAWSQMYLCFAALLGGVDLELFETTQRDVTIMQEIFIGFLDPNSKGIRVTAKEKS